MTRRWIVRHLARGVLFALALLLPGRAALAEGPCTTRS
jgi:hypothetical protein